MSRGWIIGIVCLAISGNSISNGWAQEGRPNHSGNQSFTQRLATLRKTFKREKPSTGNPQIVPQKKQRAARPQTPPSSASSKRSNASAQANREAFVARYRQKVAATKSPIQKQDNKQVNAVEVRVASKKRVGSATNEKTTTPNSRYPSADQETNDLESALADILSAEETKKAKAVQVVASEDSSPTTTRKTTTRKITTRKTARNTATRTTTKKKPTESLETKRKATRQSKTAQQGTFDVHEALVGIEDEEDFRAEAETARVDSKPATENTQEPDDLAALIMESPLATIEELPVIEESQPATSYRETEQYRGTQQYDEPEPHLETERHIEAEPYLETQERATEESVADPFSAAPEESHSANPMRINSHGRSFSQTEKITATERGVPIQQFGQLRDEVLLSSQQPVIVSHVEGPRRIMVGREATYQVVLENMGDNDAQSIDASISIPEWAEIIDVTSTGGAVERRGEGTSGGVFQWQLQELAARSSAIFRVRLIPRSGRPMQLGVQWSQAPVTSETMVEVQEPKLEVGLSGPQEVLFGQPQRYRLILRNPGTGVAEQVVVQLIPPGGDEQSATTQTIGPLQPGEVREIELELTAREAGELVMQATAIAAGGLSAEAVKNVLCRKPELLVDWRGPDTKYAGTVSAYYIRVQNPGTAMTEPVTVNFELPEGSQFVSASEGHSIEKSGRTISWRLAGLGVEEAQFMQVRCLIDQPGISRFNVTAQIDSGELSDTKTIETNIVALADLKLEVTDPQGPLPLGDSALYEIRVRNRGKTAAEGISIVGLFSAGIDPVSVEGAQYTERDGRVIFHPIKSLPAGRELVLRIRAKANLAGAHIFRAEVSCQDLDIKLAAEETTRFFKDETHWENGSWEDSQTPYAAENDETVSR